MTRQIVRLDSNTTQQSINLEFDAEILSVINPTAQSIGVSVGGNIPPQTVQSADIWIPADSGINYPVVGRNFAAAFMPPLLVNAPTGIPTAANLFFTAQEAVPNFGAFPLSTLATQSLADVVLLPATNIAASGTLNTNVPITPDILSITVYHSASQNLVSAFVVGVQSTIIYVEQNATVATPYVAQASAMVTSLDTSLNIQATCSAAGGDTVRVVGHRYPITPGVFKIDNPMPAVLAVPPWGAAPTYSAYQLQLNPALNQYIATIDGIPNGVYRIEWDISCESPTGAAAKKAYLIDTTNGRTLAGVPFPGSRGGVITAYGPGNAFALAVLNSIAITDGSYLHGAIRVWKL